MTTKPSAAMLTAALETPVSVFPGTFPSQRVTGEKTWDKVVAASINMPFTATEISAFRVRTDLLGVAGVVFLTWAVACAHNGLSAGSPDYDGQNMPPGTNYPIGLGGFVVYRRAATLEGLTGSFAAVPRTVGDGQIANRSHHYQGIGRARRPFAVEAGYFYEFSLSLTGHTNAGSRDGQDGSSLINGLGGGDGSCHLTIEYRPGMSVEV